MRERPIIMSGESVLAILGGRKTQTRRVMKPQPPDDDGKICGPEWFTPTVIDRFGDEQPGAEIFGIYTEAGAWGIKSPYGAPGDRFWVRETWRNQPQKFNKESRDYKDYEVEFQADFTVAENACYGRRGGISPVKWRSPIYMPRWASRILLEITNVRVERLQDITEADVYAEGIDPDNWDYLGRSKGEAWRQEALEHIKNGNVIGAFRCLWNSINAKRGYPWSSNPWVWVIEFKVLEPSHAK